MDLTAKMVERIDQYGGNVEDGRKIGSFGKIRRSEPAMSLKDGEIPPCFIRIDKDGRWYHHGVEMVHRPFIRLFYQNMAKDEQGRYIIDWNGERCYLEVEDTPFVVRAISHEPPATGRERFILSLTDDSEEPLAPETLFVGRDNVLYCRVRGGTFRARFSRPAYYDLARHVVEKDDGYALILEGKPHRIQMTQDHESQR